MGYVGKSVGYVGESVGYVGESVGYVGESVGYAAITHTFQPMKSIRSDVPWYKLYFIFLQQYFPVRVPWNISPYSMA